MRCPVFLIFTMVNFVVSIQLHKVEFPVKVLQNDLKAISQYYKNINEDVKAYIHWPGPITFSISTYEDLTDERYLYVEGTFIRRKDMKRSTIYTGLYYRNDRFYLKRKNSKSMKEIPKYRKLQYNQPSKIVRQKPFLAIRYASLEEIRPQIVANYNRHKEHFDKVLYNNPATFLVTYPNAETYFLEYTYLGKNKEFTEADGEVGLCALIMEMRDKKLRLSDSVRAHRLVFDQREGKLIVPKTWDIESQPFEHVLGIRMETTAFLGHVTDSGVTMLNNVDLRYGSMTNFTHNPSLFLDKLQEKIKKVEPRLYYPGVNFLKSNVPRSSKFQLDGRVFVKKVNILENGSVSEDCPFLIEKEYYEEIFTLKGRQVKSICANDEKVWLPRIDV